MRPFHHYLPIAEKLFHDGFYVTGAGCEQSAPGATYPPRKHPALYQFTWAEGRIYPEFGIVLITEGKGVFESKEMGRRTLQAGQVILLFPGIWHRYRPDPGTGWTEKWIQFNGEFAHRLLDHGILSTTRQVLSPPDVSSVEAAMDAVLTQVENRPDFNSLRYALKVFHIIDLVIDSQSPSVPVASASGRTPPNDEVAAAAQTYIWTHHQLAISVRDIAARVGVGRRTLERRFSAALGRTVLEEVTHCRFNRAERLLRETDLPVKAVVSLAGFGRAENMRQAFLRLTGLSPLAYRHHVTSRSPIDAMPRPGEEPRGPKRSRLSDSN